MVAHTTTQHVMPDRRGVSTQHRQKGIIAGESEETPKMREGEEGEVEETDRETRALRREGSAGGSSQDHTGEQQRRRWHTRLQTTPENLLGGKRASRT